MRKRSIFFSNSLSFQLSNITNSPLLFFLLLFPILQRLLFSQQLLINLPVAVLEHVENDLLHARLFLRQKLFHRRPMVYTITYLKKICELPTEPEPYMESLYQYLREEHGIYIESGRDTLEAALPSEEVQKALKIDAQMPIFIRTRQTFRKGGEVFEYSICYYPGNRYKYTVEL